VSRGAGLPHVARVRHRAPSGEAEQLTDLIVARHTWLLRRI
jgi:hypothetical protein